ncbi:hypothetical protein GQR58_007944 [Nymphon striatum]|nr:hypothetical protein GQR58_007944 [Nymphon striatum]
MASSNARYDNVDNVSDTLSSSSEISEDEIDLSSCEDYCEEIGGWGKCVEPYKFQPLKSVSEDRYTSAFTLVWMNVEDKNSPLLDYSQHSPHKVKPQPCLTANPRSRHVRCGPPALGV